jgi:phosphatidate cytidylyltransferase
LLRVISVIVLLPLVIWLMVLGGLPLLFLVWLVFALSLGEFARLIGSKSSPWLLSLVFPFVVFAQGAASVIAGLALLCFMLGLYFLTKPELPKASFEKSCAMLFGLLYVGGGLVSIYFLRTGQSALSKSEIGLSFVYLLMLVTWSNDTFAYAFGRLFGKHKLCEKVSEKKTWEGFVGGALGCLAMPFLLIEAFAEFGLTPLSGVTRVDILWVALPALVLAPLGDLVESRLKRLYEVKDSGTLLPGHGGLLDRIDALLVVAPWVLVYAVLIRPLL